MVTESFQNKNCFIVESTKIQLLYYFKNKCLMERLKDLINSINSVSIKYLSTAEKSFVPEYWHDYLDSEETMLAYEKAMKESLESNKCSLIMLPGQLFITYHKSSPSNTWGVAGSLLHQRKIKGASCSFPRNTQGAVQSGSCSLSFVHCFDGHWGIVTVCLAWQQWQAMVHSFSQLWNACKLSVNLLE